jgi:methionine-rich copper-binding protein CopC
MGPHRLILAFAIFVGLAVLTGAQADDLKVLETHPAANAVMDSRSDGFLVRFNRAIDHVNSRMFVKRGNETVETLQPRVDTEVNVLFARAPTLPAGQYTLHWVVKTMQDARIEQGDVPFSIDGSK